ncbi:MAG: GNAT family N-acetyltransferase [Simkaniaceae bacterium]|nr:GNAT family N-acetyltransferase [Simkaniaceae bacterium]
MNEISFREPNAGDVESLASLMTQLGYPIEVDRMGKNIFKYLLLKNQKVWVAECNGQVVGCIAVAITHYFHREGAFLRIIAMVVDRTKRRMGIGKSLMQVAEDYAREKNCSHVELTSGVHRETLGSHRFYKSLGYTELSSQKKYFGKKLT